MDYGKSEKFTYKRIVMGYNFDAESTSTGWDTVFFTPTGDDNQVKLEIAHTKVPGEKVGGSAMGDLFDIVIFQLTDEFDIKNLDRFEGILSHPRSEEHTSELQSH